MSSPAAMATTSRMHHGMALPGTKGILLRSTVSGRLRRRDPEDHRAALGDRGQRDSEIHVPGSDCCFPGEDITRWRSAVQVAEFLAEFVSLIGDDALQHLDSLLEVLEL